MGGVYMEAMARCPFCKEWTPHLTGWESEEPDRLDAQCVECCGERMISGRIYKALSGYYFTVPPEYPDAMLNALYMGAPTKPWPNMPLQA